MEIAHRVLARCDNVFEGFTEGKLCSFCLYDKLSKAVIIEYGSNVYFCKRCWEELGIFLNSEKEIDCESTKK